MPGPKRLIEPFNWSLSAPVRGLRGDLQELLLFPLVHRFARVRVEGVEKISGIAGPVVLVANHTSHFDCPIILAALPRRVRHRTIVAAAADYFYRLQSLGALSSFALGTIPFERHEGSKVSLERCKEALRSGWSVLIFPEGSRSKTGKLGHFKKGAAYLCVDAKVAAIPIFLEGSYDIMPKGATLPRPGRVLVKIGDPVEPAPSDSYESFTERLHRAIGDLSVGLQPNEAAV